MDDEECTASSSACEVGECDAGACVVTPLPAGASPMATCEGNMCDGAGGCVECIEASDCQVADCELAVCEAGVCSATPDRSKACAAFEGMLALRYPYRAYRVDPQTGFAIPGAQAPLVIDSFTGTGFEHVAVDPASGSFVVDALAQMDPSAGPAVPIAVSHLNLQARTFHPETGALWAVTTEGVAIIDMATGLPISSTFVTLPGPKGPEGVEPSAIAFDDGGALHAVHEGGLYTVDMASGAMELVLSLPADARALVYVPSEDLFYAAAGTAERVYRIDVDTDTIDPVAIDGLPNTGRLAYDPVSEVLYGFPPTDVFLSTGRSFHTIDAGAGSWAFGRRFGINDANAVAFEADTGRVLVTTDDNELVAVDVDAQTFELVGEMGVPVSVGRIGGMTFDDAGTLYGIAGGNSIDGGMLYQIDADTAALTALGPVPLGDYGDTAYDPDSGLLFSTVSFDENPLSRQLVTIDPETTSVETLGLSQAVSGLAYVEETGLIYGLDNALRLVSIDPGTGAADIIGIAGVTAHRTPITVVDGVLTALDARDGRVTFDLETGRATFSGIPARVSLGAYDPSSDDIVLLSDAFTPVTYRYHPATNTTTTVSDVAPDTFAGEFSVDSDGTGYVFSFGDFSEVDLDTGVATLISEGDVVFAAAFDDADVLYACVNDFPEYNLATVDVATGAVTTVATLDGLVSEMEWDGVNERLVGLLSDPMDDRLSRYVEIDRATGAMATLSQAVPFYAGNLGLFASRGR